MIYNPKKIQISLQNQNHWQRDQCGASRITNTFRPVVPVLLLPLVQQDVEVSRTLKEAKVARRWRWRENSLELSETSQLVFALCKHANVLWSQDVQHRGEEVLTETERRGKVVTDRSRVLIVTTRIYTISGAVVTQENNNICCGFFWECSYCTTLQ